MNTTLICGMILLSIFCLFLFFEIVNLKKSNHEFLTKILENDCNIINLKSRNTLFDNVLDDLFKINHLQNEKIENLSCIIKKSTDIMEIKTKFENHKNLKKGDKL